MRTSFLASILLLASTLLLASSIAQAQLTNSKWTGQLNVPNETQIVLDFKKDSVDMIIVDEGIVGEKMTYSIRDSIIIMKKISGNIRSSP
ncbi:MAG: hypothetical protein P4L51_11865 [Puia sp.]|nr:hypothetical protein [Puia sp.]